MSKYWNTTRLARVRARQERGASEIVEKSLRSFEERRTVMADNWPKNIPLILNALGLSLRRRMLARLAKEGAMSLSKLADPFHLTLPTAQFHLGILERAGLVATHKRGRVRMIMYNKQALHAFGGALVANIQRIRS